MSIRLRLTLLYTGILALTLLTFSVILYVTVESATRMVLADGLEADLSRLTDAKDFKITNVAYTPAAKGATTPYIETLDLSGKQLSRTVNENYEGIELLPLTGAELQQVRDGKALYTENTLGSDRWLVYSKRAKDTTPPGIVRVARPIQESVASLAALRRYLVIGGLIAVGLAFGVGFFLARTALQPIGRITATARTIETSRDFGRRVDHHGPEDEVGQLSTTLNAMLAALQMAYEQTEGALQAQRRFIADASHELRTPLTTIRGNLGLLGRTPPIGENDRRAVLGDMVEEAERMSRLIDNLLALARADSGLPLRVIPVPLEALIADVCRQARLLALQRTISYSSATAAAIGDPDALKQTLLILLDNALKHTPDEAIIQVTGTASVNEVAIAVHDSGPGIAPALQSQLFERFFRADAARTGGGAGLGLAIARALIEGQGGRIGVQSELGRGSTFTVTLPRTAPDSPTPIAVAE
ncbi:MAG TPA: HAMP domain-containing sensor histidine kinase [Thermomicrobiales bacterium]|jgi:signal transduction histidine kinase